MKKMKPKLLFCLPHAGGTASFFNDWQEHFSDSINLIALDYPGHGHRRFMPVCSTLTELAHDIAKLIADRIEGDASYALLGHSMGAIVALEVAYNLVAAGLPTPLGLFASSKDAPGAAVTHLSAAANDEVLCEGLIELGAFPRELIAQPRFLKPHLAIFRADLTLLENYRFKEGRPLLQCEFIVMSGQADPAVSQAGLQAWRQLTLGECFFETFEGGHFYPTSCLPLMASRVEAHLTRVGVDSGAIFREA